MTRVLVGLLIAFSVTAACGRGDSQQSGQPAPSVIAIDGSSTVFPIGEALAEEFPKTYQGAQVTVGQSGTTGGFQKFCRGETDISNASRPIKASEVQTCAAAGIEFVEIPVAYDGLSVVVNPKNTWAQSMTVAELKKLWEPAAQGKIMRWSQIRAGWPDREIHLYGAGTDSGTFDSFTESIVGKTDASRGDYTGSEDDNVLVQGVAGDENALGYFGYAYYAENKDKLKLVAIDDENADNGAGPVLPSPETVRNGTYRPLSRPLFIYVSTAKLQRPEVKAFADFIVTNSAKLAGEVGYVALSDAEQQLVKDRWGTARAGSMYGEGVSDTTPLEQLLKSGR
ncbi:MAG: PstS family phosphate ABC transporter substrate-binding protein [Vicinamibacterales bacterium]